MDSSEIRTRASKLMKWIGRFWITSWAALHRETSLPALIVTLGRRKNNPIKSSLANDAVLQMSSVSTRKFASCNAEDESILG